MAITKLKALGVTDGTLTNTQINASAAIASSKLGTIGADKMPTGSVIQTVSGSFNTQDDTTSTTPVQIWAGLTITPQFSNSIIKIETVTYVVHRDYYDGFLQIYKNGSAINELKTVIRNAGHVGATDPSAVQMWYCPSWAMLWTLSAGGTSALTYSVYAWTANSAQAIYWNEAPNNSFQPTSTMVLTEIAGS